MGQRRELVCVGLLSITVSAVANGAPITLSYAAPWECPNRVQFWRQLQTRSTRLLELKQSGPSIEIDARITDADSRYSGHLRLVESNNTVVERDVGGPNCVDVSAALALITAVTLDAAPATPRTDFSVTAIQKQRPRRFAIGPVAGIDKAVAPNVVPALGVSATYHDRAHFGSPEFRIEGLFAWNTWQRVSDAGQSVGDARFRWFASRVAACPLQAQLASITVGPCALIELGALHGEGKIHDQVQSKTGWWFAPGALLNWSVQTQPVWLRLAAGAVFPFNRDTFEFVPNPVAFRPPSSGLVAEFELSWPFY